MIYPNIRIEMERSGLAAYQLADRLGLCVNDFILKLYGGSEFTLYEVECLADVFGCSLDYLVERRVNRVWHPAHRRNLRKAGRRCHRRLSYNYAGLRSC